MGKNFPVYSDREHRADNPYYPRNWFIDANL
jgi:hypothetical protein